MTDVVAIVPGGEGRATASLRRQTLRSIEVRVDEPVSLDDVDAPWLLLAPADVEVERHAVRALLLAGERADADVVVGATAGDAFGVGAHGIIRAALLRREHLDVDHAAVAPAALLLAKACGVAARVERVDAVPVASRLDFAAAADTRSRLAAFLDAHGMTGLRDERDLDFWRRDVATALAVGEVDAAARAIAALDARLARELDAEVRVASFLALVGDADGVAAAMAYAADGTIAGPVVVRGDRELWGTGHLDGGHDLGGLAAREWLDITDLALSRVPRGQRRLLHRATISPDQAIGSTVDAFGDVVGSSLEIRFLLGSGTAAASWPVDAGEAVGVDLAWSTRGTPTDHLGRRLEHGDGGAVVLAVVDEDGVVGLSDVRAGAGGADVAFPGLRSLSGPDTLSVSSDPDGRLVWRTSTASGWRRSIATLRRGLLRIPGVRALVDTLDVAWRHTLPAAISRRLPHRRLALFESDAGRTAAGDPRAISERLHAERPDIDQAWVYRDTPDEVPPFAEPVRRHGVRHHWRANRARLWVDDGLASLWIAKPPRTTALLTPPPPVHRIGLDDPGVLVRGPAVRNLARRYRRYDLTAAPSVGAGQRVVDALAMSATPVACGIPRVDAALALRRERDALRRNLGLPDDRAIVVYAPTARALGDVVDATSPLDLAAWSRLLGTRAYLVVHPHPQQAQAVADRLRPWVRHVASHEDITPFLAAADVVVSDYSSVIALALALDAPVVLHQPDRVEYLNRIRGVYPQRGAPGPVVEDLDALVAAVVDVIDRPDEWRRTWAADRTLLAAGLCGPVDGESSARAVTAAIDASGMAGR